MTVNPSSTNTLAYIGRFAPSPSGPLHIGSLIAALASYLDAKHHGGKWLVRMEDIDPPREEVGAQERILNSLKIHGFEWDGEVMYQSKRLQHYQNLLDALSDYTYPCQCSRPRLMSLHGVYDSHCALHPVDTTSSVMTSTRLSLQGLSNEQILLAENYHDVFQSDQTQSLSGEVGDFILRRKDGLFAYQLAVVADDITQGITHIIRGSDLLSSTPRQRYLWLLLQSLNDKPSFKSQRENDNTTHPLPTYGHIPVASNHLGQKLSKQHRAIPINDQLAFDNLCFAFRFLQQSPPNEIIESKNITSLLQWGSDHWQRKSIPQTLSFVVENE